MPKVTGEDLLRMARTAKKTQLQSVRLLESSSKLGTIRAGELPPTATQSVNLGLRIDRAKKLVEVIVTFKLVVAYEGAEDTAPALTVAATFSIWYAIIKPASKKTLQSAARTTSMM